MNAIIQSCAQHTAEILWMGKQHSLLMVLLKNAILSASDTKLQPVAEQMAVIAGASQGSMNLMLHAPIDEHHFPAIAAPDDNAAHIVLIPVGFDMPPVFEQLRGTHRLWIEGDGALSLLTFLPRQLDTAWIPLAESRCDAPFIATAERPTPGQLKKALPTAGLYVVEAALRKANRHFLMRLFGNQGAFKSLLVDPASGHATPMNHWPDTPSEFRLRQYNDLMPLSFETHGDLLRAAFTVRLPGGGVFLDVSAMPNLNVAKSTYMPLEAPDIVALDVRPIGFA